jgi:hypothetical protein
MMRSGEHAARVRVRYYTEQDDAAWDDFVSRCPLGTFLHTRRFLSYHGQRFIDRSLMFFDATDRLCGLLPAALEEISTTAVVSHPGSTYGGLLHATTGSGLDACAMLAAAAIFLADRGFTRLIYKCVPPHLHVQLSQVDSYALWRQGARLSRRDLWNVIDLSHPRKHSEARRRRLRRANEAGIRVLRDNSDGSYEQFHDLLTIQLAERHSVKPVHSVAEMKELHQRFTDCVNLWCAIDETGSLVAGEWIFDLGEVAHGQYGIANEIGRQSSAQDLLIERIIQHSIGKGCRWFSFGASTQEDGAVLNTGLFRYKESFGFGSVVQDFYDLSLIRET